ncbi:pre-mRNA-splicing factor ISY1 homolog [Homarus americanus]|uniref:Pre-mRNA-splicing factor ISY1-like n=1 Tax=Homarus americanus TaxID=6706 RepID=A0A8J5J680_HOMAM|nr:pre-mRNA-splicing factor ISY1 homolog [Homarus americanus]XP_042209955.1 pre-mRNA-splicing factor ISY1 homolog [Homarus americanus]KAG7153406.1 Pre-mRNA-splicing factor ISY1-like [Homarus americanus]
MARNAEKAMTTLARWRAAQEGGTQQQKVRRPYLASECEDLREAEKWRNQVISEIARKVSQIQNAGLGEFRIRDLNDEINKLLREKGHWEVRIKELGGPDYVRVGPKMTDMDGQEAPGNRGYMYFGAAKDLPGVRELFEQEPPPPPRKTRGELMKDIDADYYGYRDDDDGVLIPLERKAERKAIQAAVKQYTNKKLAAITGEDEEGEETQENGVEDEDDVESENEEISLDETDERSEVQRFMAHVPNIPTQADIENALVERKKRELLQTYLGD